MLADVDAVGRHGDKGVSMADDFGVGASHDGMTGSSFAPCT